MTYQTPPLVKHLYSLGVCPLSAPPGPLGNCYSVLMDGKLMGYVLDEMAPLVEQKLRSMKVKGLGQVSFKDPDQEIF